MTKIDKAQFRALTLSQAAAYLIHVRAELKELKRQEFFAYREALKAHRIRGEIRELEGLFMILNDDLLAKLAGDVK